MLKVTEARNLPKSVKVALRVRANVDQTQEELLQWVKSLNPVFNTEHWKVLDKQSEPKGQRLIMHIDRDSLVTIRSIGNKIFTGLPQGTVIVLKDPEAPKTQAVLDTTSSKSASEEEGDDTPSSSDGRPGVESSSTDQGPPLTETQSEEEKPTREERMETDSPPIDKKE
jgi:hypothetical protein